MEKHLPKNKFLHFFLLWISILLNLSGCLGGGVSPINDVPGSNPQPILDPINRGGDDEPFPMPTTIQYAIAADALYSQNKQFIDIEGVTFQLPDNQPVATTVRINKKNSLEFIEVTSNALGQFVAQLPADQNKPIEFIELRTVQNGEPTSEVIELTVSDIEAKYLIQVELDKEPISTVCREQIPEIDQILEPSFQVAWQIEDSVFFTLFSKDQPAILGVRHELSFSDEKTLRSSGSYPLAILDGQGFHYESGCYESNDYQLDGELQGFEYTPEGRYIHFKGTFTATLTGQACSASCHLSGTWQARSFMTWQEVEQQELGQSQDIDIPISKGYSLQKLEIKTFPMEAKAPATFLELKELKPNSQLLLNRKQVYRINHGPQNQVEVLKLFALPLGPTPGNLDQIIACPPEETYLTHVLPLNDELMAISFEGHCGKAGFFLLSTQQETQLKDAAKVLLPNDYTFIRSPLVFQNHLLLIGTNFPFSQPESFSAELHSVLFAYDLDFILDDPQVTAIEISNMKNPKELLLREQTIWILDGAIRDLNLFNEDGGFLQTLTWQQGQFELDAIVAPYFRWRMGEAFNFRNTMAEGSLSLSGSGRYLFVLGSGYLATLDLEGGFETDLPEFLQETPLIFEDKVEDLTWASSLFAQEYPLREFARILEKNSFVYLSSGLFEEQELLVLKTREGEPFEKIIEGPVLQINFEPNERNARLFKVGNRVLMVYKNMQNQGMIVEVKIDPIVGPSQIKLN